VGVSGVSPVREAGTERSLARGAGRGLAEAVTEALGGTDQL